MLKLDAGTEDRAKVLVGALPGVPAEMALEIAVDVLREALYQVQRAIKVDESYAAVEHATEVTLARLLISAFGDTSSARIAYAMQHLRAIEIKRKVDAGFAAPFSPPAAGQA